MKRREFFRKLGLTLAAGLAARRIVWPLPAEASGPEVRLALLADAHLRDGNDKRPEARALARAVAEIRALTPAPDVVLFAGDLAHDGSPNALALGREILTHLPAPLLAVPGEGDGGAAVTRDWRRMFGESPFLYSFQGVHLLGLEATWQATAWGPAFALGEDQNRWLAVALPRLDPQKPLVVLSHAPLEHVFRPWGQWTVDSDSLLRQLARFPHVLCLNGHVHQASSGTTGASSNTPPPLAGGGWGEGEIPWHILRQSAHFTPTLTLPHSGGGSKSLPVEAVRTIGLPSTAWPLPRALLGTPRKLRPGLGPRGCGWAICKVGSPRGQFESILWEA